MHPIPFSRQFSALSKRQRRHTNLSQQRNHNVLSQSLRDVVLIVVDEVSNLMQQSDSRAEHSINTTVSLIHPIPIIFTVIESNNDIRVLYEKAIENNE